jgi:hypothetical protein
MKYKAASRNKKVSYKVQYPEAYDRNIGNVSYLFEIQ